MTMGWPVSVCDNDVWDGWHNQLGQQHTRTHTEFSRQHTSRQIRVNACSEITFDLSMLETFISKGIVLHPFLIKCFHSARFKVSSSQWCIFMYNAFRLSSKLYLNPFPILCWRRHPVFSSTLFGNPVTPYSYEAFYSCHLIYYCFNTVALKDLKTKVAGSKYWYLSITMRLRQFGGIIQTILYNSCILSIFHKSTEGMLKNKPYTEMLQSWW